MYIWLSPYSKDPTQLFQDANRWPAGGNTGTLNLFWGNYQNGCSDAALEIDVVWNTRAYPRVARYAYDPCSPSRTSQNGFAAAAATNKSISNIPLYYTASISITNGFLVRVIPLYTDSYVGASSNPQTLPPQGTIITSVGKTANNTVQRQLTVFQGYPEVPAELFPFTLFWP